LVLEDVGRLLQFIPSFKDNPQVLLESTLELSVVWLILLFWGINEHGVVGSVDCLRQVSSLLILADSW
jgi:hypothetical protein